MDSLPQDWIALIGSIAIVMIMIKAALKYVLPKIVARIKVLETDEAEIKASFKVLAAVVGVVLAFTVYSGTSYFKEFDLVYKYQWLEYADHVMVGVFCSLGEKFVADSWDKFKEVLGLVNHAPVG